MKHYKDNDWADWARGAVTGERQSLMKAHLDSGCKKCQRVAELWRSVVQAAANEAFYEPDSSALRIAKSLAAGLPAAEQKSLAHVIAELVFDTARQPLLAGVRNVTATPRQLMYRAAEHTIDLRVERQAGSDRMTLVGQILSESGQSVRNIPVTILSGIGPLASGTTNAYGEFHLEFEGGLRVQLSVSLHGVMNIFVPLDALAYDGPADGPAGRRGAL